MPWPLFETSFMPSSSDRSWPTYLIGWNGIGCEKRGCNYVWKYVFKVILLLFLKKGTNSNWPLLGHWSFAELSRSRFIVLHGGYLPWITAMETFAPSGCFPREMTHNVERSYANPQGFLLRKVFFFLMNEGKLNDDEEFFSLCIWSKVSNLE